MFYETEENKHGLRHDPFKALVVPRPIGWISTLSPDGVLNLAPYSYFNGIADRPKFVMFSSGGRKDSVVNAEATGEFVCSMATYELKDEMNLTSAQVGPEVDEMELAKLASTPSKLVKPPRVARSPAALECKYHQTVTLPGVNGLDGNYLVIGQVVGIYIADEFIADGMVDITKYRPIARLGYMDYTVVDEVFSMMRPD